MLTRSANRSVLADSTKFGTTATYKVAPSVFKELGAQVTVLSAQPNGLNINDNCGSTHMEQLQAAVLAEHADLGIAFDGDGDRVLMVDHTGMIVDGDDLLFIIARDLHERNKLHGGVVGTLMSNLGLELALAYRRFGSAVTVVETGKLLAHADPETDGKIGR